MNDDQRKSSRTLVLKLGVIVVGMFGFGYALVPFYEKICEVTGLRNIARADEVGNSQVDFSRTVRIEFDSNVRKLPWTFRPLDVAFHEYRALWRDVRAARTWRGRLAHAWHGPGWQPRTEPPPLPTDRRTATAP